MKSLLLFLVLSRSILSTISQEVDWQAVEKVFGRKGILQGDVFKLTFPRTDLKVNIGDLRVDPGLALTSWIAFEKLQDHVMMMGDLVLLEKEVDPAMKKLVSRGVEVTALHNHIINESPKILYMHFSGHGDPMKLAQTMQEALALTGTPLGSQPPPQPTISFDWSRVESILGRTGQHKGNLLQVGVPRAETIIEAGATVPPAMGVATAINFQIIGDRASTTGDFVLVASEVNPVVQALTEHGIAVTAIHSHMLHESPRLFFLHFWGYDKPEKLAEGLKAALDKTNSTKSN